MTTATTVSSRPALPAEVRESLVRARALRRRRRAKGVTGLSISAVVLLAVVFGPMLAPHDPAAMDLDRMLLPPVWQAGSDPDHLLGTDAQGRDVLSRLVVGARVSVVVGLSAVVLSGALGLFLGLVSGYVGGFVDTVIMRIVDSLLAIPTMLFMLVVALVAGTGLLPLVIVIALTSWLTYARFARGEVLSLRERDFVAAARLNGLDPLRVILGHLLPNVLPTFLVIATLSVGGIILTESSLSFLGLGIQPPQVSWGQMLSEGRQYLATSWWIATLPGAAIVLTVLGVTLLGDWLRDILDVKVS